MREPLPWLAAIEDVPHGGGSPDTLLDLSASIAPLGPSRRARLAAARAIIETYPERDAGSLLRAAARELRTDRDRLVAGAGAGDLLLAAFRAHLRPGDTVLLVVPAYGEYARAAAACGATARPWSGAAGDGSIHASDVRSCAAAVRLAGATVAVLARPANPTGVLTDSGVVAALLAATAGTTWVIDESFLGLCDTGATIAGADAVAVRSLTKELAIPGLRVAFADAPPPTARAMRVLLPPWPVSSPGIAAAVAGLCDHAHRRATLAAVAAGRDALLAAAVGCGHRPLPAAANFVCIPVRNTAAAVASMAARGIAIRDCGDLGLPGAIRIAVPAPSEVARVLDALTAVLKDRP